MNGDASGGGSSVGNQIRQINLKQGMPTVEHARARLLQELAAAERRGDIALKIVHGYGSTGVGGRLKDAIRSSLRRRRKEGKIRHVVAGENWSAFDRTTAEVLDACPALRRDPDLDRANEGVTIVLL